MDQGHYLSFAPVIKSGFSEGTSLEREKTINVDQPKGEKKAGKIAQCL